jgi:DNA repair exonuclease SbcCD ATPase subunit
MSRGLVSVQLWDFCQFKRAKVPLRRQGLVWLGGKNHDTNSADSNGAGKTNLLKAIGWCIFGQTPESEIADDVIREGAKRARVILKLEGGWKICRERYKGAPRLTLSRNGETIRGKRTEIQERIDKLIGMSWRAFLNTTYYASRDNRRFVHPETSNADRHEILFNILAGHVYAEALEWVKEQAKKYTLEIQALESDITEAKAKIEAFDLSRLKARRKAWEGQRKARLDAIRGRRRELAEEARQKAPSAKRVAKLERELLDARKRFRRAEVASMKANDLAKELAPALDNASRLRATIQANEKANQERQAGLSRLRKLDKCPTCQRSLKGANAAEHLDEMGATIGAQAEQLSKWKVELSELEKEIEKRTTDIQELRSQDLSGIVNEIQGLETDRAALRYAKNQARQILSEYKARKVDLESVKSEPNPYDEELDVAREGRRKAKDTIAVARGEIERLSLELAHWEFWKKGFSASGLPSFVLDGVMPELTERANHYLETLSDGSISVLFSTQRELTSAKGEYRDEIDVTWTIEGVAKRNPSGGQWRKIEIATDLALMDLALAQDSGGLDFLALDEVLDGGLDSVGRSRLLTLLHDIRKQKGTIFVVSHDADLAGVFDRSVIVTKRKVSKVTVKA